MIGYPAIAAVSAAILAYEVLLVRLFAITQWHHFAFMAISIALLGFGVSGALLAVFRQWFLARSAGAFALAAALFASPPRRRSCSPSACHSMRSRSSGIRRSCST